MKFNRALRVHIIVVSMTIAAFYSLIAVPEEGSAYIPHSPITINSNSDFVPANGVVGGAGTPLDPFIIEGWEINASGTIGISISNTDSHFRIRNVYIYSGGLDGSGVSMSTVNNGRIENATITRHAGGIHLLDTLNITIAMSNITQGKFSAIWASRCPMLSVVSNNISMNEGTGVFLRYSDYSLVRDNDLIGNWEGIELDNSENVTISGNTIRNDVDEWISGIHMFLSNNATIEGNVISIKNATAVDISDAFGTIIRNNTIFDSKVGLNHYMSSNSTVTNNTFTRNGLILSGYRIYDFNTHIISTDNLVNGLPLYYHKDCTNLNVDGIPVGQLIAVNCTGVVAKNLVIPETDVSIQMAFVDDALIASNSLSGRLASVTFFLSDKIHIEKNTIGDSMYGLVLRYNTNIMIANNTMTKCDYAGIDLMECGNIKVSGNSVSECGYGLRLDRTMNPEVWQNTFSDNYYGIYLDSAGSLRVYHNNFINNTVQARPDSLPGYSWDDSYPSGGNYWSDYSGLDQFNGPLQDLPGSDGIGDTPYLIGPRYQDSYPLMGPFGLVHPLPPDLHAAALSGANSENVTLSWTLSPDDGGGLGSVIGYEIYRNTTFDPDALGYQSIALVPNGTAGFVDASVGEGDPNNYFYQVCALDSGGNSSCAERQAGKFTRPVSEGPNLISIPLIQLDETIEKTLQTVEFDKAWNYDAPQTKWISYMTSKPYKGELKTINNKMGVWVNVTVQSNLTVAGIVPLGTTIQLKAGWNLVGFPSFRSSYSVSDLKAETGAARVEGLDSSSPPYYLRVMNDAEYLQTGQGYWVHLNGDTSWTVANL
jgi:parallel beta-helix repeat protein